jgi:ATP-dependent Clp protease ATP-binding subunit ClpA
MSEPNKLSDFEKILNRSFDLAVEYQHEYVTLEHLLQACLEMNNLQELLSQMGKKLSPIKQDLLKFLKDTTKHSVVADIRFQPKYTATLLTLIKQAKAQSMFMGKQSIDAIDIVMAMFNVSQSWAVYYLNSHGITKSSMSDTLTRKGSQDDSTMSEDDAKLLLSQFAVNLNQKALQNKIDPLIGRETDVEQITHTLSRKNKNNVLLVGHPGTGKTQIVEGLAKRIVENQVPSALQQQEIWSLDVSAVVAGTKFRGDFEERMKNLITALKKLPNVILFIDEIHMILGAGAGGGQSSMDVANILKPALGRGEIKTIGSTTHEEYRKHFEKDRALLRRFLKQDVEEPTPEDTKKIITGLLSSFEKFHGITYDVGCVDSSVDLSVKYIFSKFLPDKAIDLIDAAGAAVKVSQGKVVSVQDIQQQLSSMAKISLDTVEQKETDITKDLETNIQAKLFGQDSAITQVSESVWMTLSGLRESNKTMGSFLFTGPSGTGKTELAKLLAQNLNYAFVRFDMSEFQEKHALSRLIGSPPGYVGYADGNAGSGALINALEQSPQCVLLIDEVEKANPEVLNIFLQAMDNGQITSANQKTVTLKNVILIYTSNLGAAGMERAPLGFGREDRKGEDEIAIKQFFAPEFRNRLDAVIHFDKLQKITMHKILDKFLDQLNVLCKQKHVTVVVDPDAKEWLIDHGFDPQMGARPLGRCIDANIKKPMSKEILFGKLVHGGTVLVSVDEHSKSIKLDFLSKVVPTNTAFDLMQDHMLDVEI